MAARNDLHYASQRAQCLRGDAYPRRTESSIAIGQAIRANSGELLQVETGSLYPALHRLERQGWLASEWGVSNNKQRAKYYRLTAAGKKQLSAEESKWELLVKAITRVMKPAN